MSLHYDKFDLIEMLENRVYTFTYMDERDMKVKRCLTLNRDIIGQLDAMPAGFHSLMDAADSSHNSFAALDVYSKEWHIVYIDRAINMREHRYDTGTV